MKHSQKPPIAQTQNPDMKGSRDKKPQSIEPIPQRKNRIVNPDGDDQESRRLDDHLHCIPGKWNQPFKRGEVKESQQKFTGQHSPQIRHDAEPGNTYEYKSQAQNQGCNILKKRSGGFPKPV